MKNVARTIPHCRQKPFSIRIPTFTRQQCYNAAATEELLALLYRHKVVVIESFPLDDELLLVLARQLGVPESVHPPAFRSPLHPEIRIQSNIPGVGADGGGEYWHSDGPWTDPPSAATLLLCMQAPAMGGETLFVDMQAALLRLSPDLRKAIENRSGRYPCREIYRTTLKGLQLEDPEFMDSIRDLSHPLIRCHPVTGKSALYLNAKWLTSVDGLDFEEGAVLLARLYGVAIAAAGIYSHRWETGDLLIWDNAAVMHKAAPADPRYEKTTHRITIRGGQQ